MEPLYRFEAEFTGLVALGLVPEGVRLDAHFEGTVVEGQLAGATVRGIDYLRFGPMASQCSTCVKSSCTFATATTEWHQLNRTVGTFNGVANPGTGTLIIEVQAFVPKTVAERVLS